jgi:hypothetical protein
MKSKQLANVLIKIVGLYVCLCAIPGLLAGIFAAVLWASEHPKGNDGVAYVLSEGVGAVIQLVVGIILVVKSGKLSEFWFRNDE